MPNMQSILRAHNKAELAAKPSEEERKCNCRKKDSCPPLQNECLTKNVVYKATVSEQNTTCEKVYFGLTENSFKQRYNGHTQSFRHDKHRTNTELSKFIRNIKDNDKAYEIKWSIFPLLLKPEHVPMNRNAAIYAFLRNFLLYPTPPTHQP